MTLPLSTPDLDLDAAVVGDGLLMSRRPPGPFVIFALESGRARRIGAFSDVREAWEAIDALDLAAAAAPPAR
jgi:hypothetical protein